MHPTTTGQPLRSLAHGSIAPLIAMVAVCGVLLPKVAFAATLQFLVPAYANPCCDDGPAMWASLTSTVQSGAAAVTVILNPENGPGPGPIDPNYVHVGGTTGPVLDLVAEGGSAVGYVPTGFGSRPLAAIQSDIDLYYDAGYWRGAGIQVQGIFLDEMSNDLADVGLYQTITAYVRAKDVMAHVFGNPGVASVVDSSGGSSGHTLLDYVTSVDTMVTFEGFGENYRAGYMAPSWSGSLPRSAFAHLVHSEPSSHITTDIELASARGAGFVYLTADAFSPNPWDNWEEAYWFAEVAAVLAVPEPAPAPWAVMGVGMSMLALRRRDAARARQPIHA